jgi:predicted site-specific integrase-resolvase
MQNTLLKPAEVREALRIAPKKFHDLVRAGDLEVIRLGARTVRVAQSAVQRLLEERSRDRGQ